MTNVNEARPRTAPAPARLVAPAAKAPAAARPASPAPDSLALARPAKPPRAMVPVREPAAFPDLFVVAGMVAGGFVGSGGGFAGLSYLVAMAGAPQAAVVLAGCAGFVLGGVALGWTGYRLITGVIELADPKGGRY